jgi:proteic killer suppression protein
VLDTTGKTQYTAVGIKSFKNTDAEKIFNGYFAKGLPHDIQERALRKLVHLDSAISLNDLRFISGDRIERLKGDQEGQYSIRVNQQWRIIFSWEDNHAYDVEIVDYH